MIDVKHNLNQKIDEIYGMPLNVFVGMQEGLRITKNDVEQKLVELFGDKSSWFDVVIDESAFNIRITPKSETSGDSDKMRLYRYFIDHHGDEIASYARDRIHWNSRIAFRAEVRGVGYVY